METFFGRNNEISKFLTAFAEVRKRGRINVLVSGYAGEGKTALVNQFALNAEKKGALFIHSKAYESYDSTPYTAITIAMGMFVKKLLLKTHL